MNISLIPDSTKQGSSKPQQFMLVVGVLAEETKSEDVLKIFKECVNDCKDLSNQEIHLSDLFVGSSNELGAFESGATAKLMGTVTAVVFGGTMTLLTVGFTAFASPDFRKLDLQKDIEAHESAI